MRQKMNNTVPVVQAKGNDVFKCRCCQSYLNKSKVVLKKMPLTDDFISVGNTDRLEYLEDIQIFECQECGLVQNPADFDHEGYYKDYQYSTGHSKFVRNFMKRYAEILCNFYQNQNRRRPLSILEIGSGDGEQLKQFKKIGNVSVFGVEPSYALATIANTSGIPTHIGFFGEQSLKRINEKFDICLSSYTLDHVRNPIDYLKTTYELLNENGILAFEVHNLEDIIERTEYCLFEHEHTIHLTASDASRLVEAHGFKVLSVNPIPRNEVRANSLMVVAVKSSLDKLPGLLKFDSHSPEINLLNQRIRNTIDKIDLWINSLPTSSQLVGFGAGGRGVMTLAALNSCGHFRALFDSNYSSGQFLTPKTRIPIVGPSDWSNYNSAYCIIFSFGYLEEIKQELLQCGFKEEKIISLASFY